MDDLEVLVVELNVTIEEEVAELEPEVLLEVEIDAPVLLEDVQVKFTAPKDHWDETGEKLSKT